MKFSSSLLASLALMLPIGFLAPLAASAQSSGGVEYPLADAVLHDRMIHHEYTVSSYTLQHHLITLSWTADPQTRAKFEGADAMVVTSHYTGSIDGTPGSTSTDMDYFSVTTHERIGVIVSTQGKNGSETRYSVVVHSDPLPKTAKIGDSGKYEQLVGYTDASKTRLRDRRVTVWSLESDPQSTADALFCVSEDIAATPDVRQVARECYHEDASGTLSRPFEISQITTILH